MTDIINFPGITSAPESADQLLEKAKTWDLETVLIIGETEDGKLRVGGNVTDQAEVVWLLQRAKWRCWELVVGGDDNG